MVFLWLAACTPGSATDTDPVDTDTPAGLTFRAVTFNTGTTEGLAHDPTFDGYGEEQAGYSDQHYGDGLAWVPAITAAQAFLAEVDADIVAFQEIFDPTECAAIPTEAQAGFICDGWSPEQGSVAEMVTGAGYTVQCHPGNSDKCLAVHERLGVLEPLEGRVVDGCGSGARVAVARIAGVLDIVSVHGSSGLQDEDQECRARQVQAIFDAGGLVGEAPTLVLGDFNTDPGRWGAIDASAAEWNANVGEGERFHWITDIGPEATPSYQGIVNIDHQASDTFTGSCFTEGVSDGTQAVYGGVYFDHHPVVCDLID